MFLFLFIFSLLYTYFRTPHVLHLTLSSQKLRKMTVWKIAILKFYSAVSYIFRIYARDFKFVVEYDKES